MRHHSAEGRHEYVLVHLVRRNEGAPAAYPIAGASGSIHAFAPARWVRISRPSIFSGSRRAPQRSSIPIDSGPIAAGSLGRRVVAAVHRTDADIENQVVGPDVVDPQDVAGLFAGASRSAGAGIASVGTGIASSSPSVSDLAASFSR